jgi:chromosome segregation ATPase
VYLGLFGKKKSRDDIIAEGIASQAAEADAQAAGQDKKEDNVSSGNPKLDMEITKIKAQLESQGEIRKANSERFSRISEQMGELRGMIMDTNKTMSKIEVSATKAIDLVESVQPEKLMIEIRKQEGKMESLKANIESNEAMMRDIMEEIKKMRAQMNFYKGIEQVAKLNDEVKTEIFNIKKVEATIERHADKAETIFIDLEKKFSEYEKFHQKMDDIEMTFKVIQEDFDKIKFQLTSKSEKKEFINLMDKFTEFEKHTGDVLKLLDERSKQSKSDIKEAIAKMRVEAKGKNISFSRELPSVDSLGKQALGINQGTIPFSAQSPQKQESANLELPDIKISEPTKNEEENLKDVLKARKTG